MQKRNPMAILVAAAAVTLAVLHQDLWFWSDRTLVFGWLPIGLAYHAGFSVTAAALWAWAVKSAWPTAIERWADQPPTDAPPPPGSLADTRHELYLKDLDLSVPRAQADADDEADS